MLINRFIVIVIGVLFFQLSICSHATAQTNSTKAGFDSLSIINELITLSKEFAADLKRGDSVALGKAYAIDAKIFNNAAPTKIGREVITRFYGQTIRAGITSITLVTMGVWGSSNDLVTEEGTVQLAFANGTTVVKGKYLILWKREEGKLKIFRDSFTMDPSN